MTSNNPIMVCRRSTNLPFTDANSFGATPRIFATIAEAEAFAAANGGYVSHQTWANSPPADQDTPPDDPEWETGPQAGRRRPIG